MKIYLFIAIFLTNLYPLITSAWWTDSEGNLSIKKRNCGDHCIPHDESCPHHLCKIENNRLVRDPAKVSEHESQIRLQQRIAEVEKVEAARILQISKGKDLIEKLTDYINKKTGLSNSQKQSLEAKLYPIYARLNVGLLRDALRQVGLSRTDSTYENLDKVWITDEINAVLE